MKKIISVIIAMLLAVMPAAAQEESKKENSGEAKLLFTLGIVKEAGYNGRQPVKRGDFASSVASLIGLSAITHSCNTVFPDVTEKSKNSGAVKVLSDMGIVSGYDSGLFGENDTLKRISVMLGKYREIIADKRKNSFSYGLGEKYDITYGNDISNCLSSELALLGAPETEILFFKRYYEKHLQQYRRREPSVKGDGDIIVLADESSSTREIAPWVKAFALALMDIALHGNKKFALVHFASSRNVKTDVFESGKYTTDDVLAAAEHFFGGGTDFEAPLNEALRLLTNGFESADVVIITDGECEVSDEFAERFTEEKLKNRLTVTGILLSADDDCGKSLLPFCDKIYRLGDMSADEIALEVIGKKM